MIERRLPDGRAGEQRAGRQRAHRAGHASPPRLTRPLPDLVRDGQLGDVNRHERRQLRAPRRPESGIVLGLLGEAATDKLQGVEAHAHEVGQGEQHLALAGSFRVHTGGLRHEMAVDAGPLLERVGGAPTAYFATSGCNWPHAPKSRTRYCWPITLNPAFISFLRIHVTKLWPQANTAQLGKAPGPVSVKGRRGPQRFVAQTFEASVRRDNMQALTNCRRWMAGTVPSLGLQRGTHERPEHDKAAHDRNVERMFGCIAETPPATRPGVRSSALGESLPEHAVHGIIIGIDFESLKPESISFPIRCG